MRLKPDRGETKAFFYARDFLTIQIKAQKVLISTQIVIAEWYLAKTYVA